MKTRKNVSYEYKNISTKELQIDELYQRDIDPKRLMRMTKEYDPCLVNPIKVSFRDGKYWIYDGQHTVAMLKSVLAKGNDTVVECKVWHGLTRLDEMELFVAQNGASASVSTNAKLRALYNFGDKDVRGMVEMAGKAGVLVDFTHGQGYNKCIAYTTLMKAYMMMPNDQYVSMLKVLRDAWDGIPDSFVQQIINGMRLFYKHYYGRFKESELKKSLKRVSPVQIVREGKSFGAAQCAVNMYARVILRVYNNNRSANRLPDEL